MQRTSESFIYDVLANSHILWIVVLIAGGPVSLIVRTQFFIFDHVFWLVMLIVLSEEFLRCIMWWAGVAVWWRMGWFAIWFALSLFVVWSEIANWGDPHVDEWVNIYALPIIQLTIPAASYLGDLVFSATAEARKGDWAVHILRAIAVTFVVHPLWAAGVTWVCAFGLGGVWI